MGRVVVIGEGWRTSGFMLAGALVLPAEDAAAARHAWQSLPPDVAMVVLTPTAAAAIGAPADTDAAANTGEAAAAAALPNMPLTVVMPR